MKLRILITLLTLCAILLSSCGNKGALVMPPTKPQSAPQQPDQMPKDTSNKAGSSS